MSGDAYVAVGVIVNCKAMLFSGRNREGEEKANVTYPSNKKTVIWVMDGEGEEEENHLNVFMIDSIQQLQVGCPQG